MKNSKFVFDKIVKLIEQGLVSSRDLTDELVAILKSKRDEIVFKMKLTSKDEFMVLTKRVDNLEKKIQNLTIKKKRKVKKVKKS
jgi:polyhydroxyalkanoate synthesis regulator phasin|tara:strand:- start:2392 stop:2643 length:252 start_codon:yes stop_codon:yes gene_type:complete